MSPKGPICINVCAWICYTYILPQPRPEVLMATTDFLLFQMSLQKQLVTFLFIKLITITTAEINFGRTRILKSTFHPVTPNYAIFSVFFQKVLVSLLRSLTFIARLP